MSYLDLSSVFPVPRLLMGTRRRAYPIARDQAHFQISEDYIGCRALYEIQPLGTSNALTPTAVLVSETITREEADAIWFTRVYSTIPSNRSEPTSAAVQFPGSLILVTADTNNGRAPYTETVLCREEFAYFLTSDPFGEIDPENAIPVIQAFAVMTGGANPQITQYLNNVDGVFTDASTPSLTEYNTMVANGDEIAVRDSEISQYAGNIWQRKTVYTKAR